jgi:hypothetical protein
VTEQNVVVRCAAESIVAATPQTRSFLADGPGSDRLFGGYGADGLFGGPGRDAARHGWIFASIVDTRRNLLGVKRGPFIALAAASGLAVVAVYAFGGHKQPTYANTPDWVSIKTYSFAAGSGDPKPLRVEVVQSTHRRAVESLMGVGIGPARDVRVYAVALEGRFTLHIPHPPEAAAPRGRFLVALFDEQRGTMLDFGLLPRKPDLSALGRTYRLRAPA